MEWSSYTSQARKDPGAWPDEDLKWWHVRWRLAARAIARFTITCSKVLLPLCLLIAIAYGVLYLLSPWLDSRHIARVDPRLSLLPIDLPTKTEAPLSNAVVDCYGFSIRLPNKEVAKTFRNNSSTLFLFSGGGMLEVPNPARDFSMFGMASVDNQAAKVICPESFSSKFKLMKAAMGTTPDQAKWWKLRTVANKRVEYLLFNKYLVISHPVSTDPFTLVPIYTISAGALHGFQIGNPDTSPYDAHVDLFDQADRYFSFDVSGPQKHGQILTQAEMNAIVASIKPNL